MVDLGTKRLETERLILRRFELNDLEELFYHGYITDEVMAKDLSWKPCKTIEEQRVIIEDWIGKYQNLDFYKWLIETKDTHELIGGIDICNLYKDERKNYGEVGYCIGSKWWNNGYATEALKRVIEYFLLECDFHLVEAHCAGYNQASARVMEKAGMKKDGELRERRFDRENRAYTPQIYYSILKDEIVSNYGFKKVK